MAEGTRSDGRREWQNTTNLYVSAVHVDRRGEAKGITVEPHGRVWMNDEEEELTAKAPSDPAKNPFLPQPYEDRDVTTDEVVESGERPVFVLAEEERYVPPRGSADSREETDHKGTPTTARRRRGGTRAKAAK
jgi:hypothetical protein